MKNFSVFSVVRLPVNVLMMNLDLRSTEKNVNCVPISGDLSLMRCSRLAEAAREESEREQAEINRKQAKKEAYDKALVYFESESIDAHPKLSFLEQKLTSLEANRTIKKEIQ
jgi:hypothetical protein